VNVIRILVPVYRYIGRLYAYVFISRTCALYIAFGKCFYNCDVVVKICAHYEFNPKETVCLPSPCIMKHNKLCCKLGLWGNFGRKTWALGEFCMGCSLLKSTFLVYCVMKRIVDHAPRHYLYARTRLRLWLPKVR